MKNWVKEYVNILIVQNKIDSNVVALVGQLNSNQAHVAMAHVYSLYAYVLGGVERQMEFINTSCLAIFKEIFTKIYGFSEDMRVGEDQELALKVIQSDKKIMFVPQINVFHNHGITKLGHMLYKNYKYGKLIGLNLYRKHPRRFKIWLKILINPIVHGIFIFPIALATTMKIIKYNIRFNRKVVMYSPLIFLNKILFRIGIFQNELKRGKTDENIANKFPMD